MWRFKSRVFYITPSRAYSLAPITTTPCVKYLHFPSLIVTNLHTTTILVFHLPTRPNKIKELNINYKIAHMLKRTVIGVVTIGKPSKTRFSELLDPSHFYPTLQIRTFCYKFLNEPFFLTVKSFVSLPKPEDYFTQVATTGHI